MTASQRDRPSSPDLALKHRIQHTPPAFEPTNGGRLLASVASKIEGFDQPVRDLIEGVGGNSPYLTRLMTRGQTDLRTILDQSPEMSVANAIARASAAASVDEPDRQARELRHAKAVAALTLALAEIGGALTTMQAAALLSAFADAVCAAALRMGLTRAEAKGFRPVDPAAPDVDCGICILAMGKMGGGELNYSSDIDLVVIFDPEAPALGGADTAKMVALAATKTMVARLSDQTSDGYVFRTDLRLRPDPGATAAAVSIDAAERYYEAQGQNWERAAYIKARPAAGDIALGEKFLHRLRPFVWRKYLDYAAIEDIHSIRRQIHAAKGGAEITFAGHDVKTGRGGIREIEFLAQTQQLILGGKHPELRDRATLPALIALAAVNVIDQESEQTLREAYCYLRKVEHRLQMIGDEQTHRIPEDPDQAARLAMFLGAPSLAAFEQKLIAVLTANHARFSTMFEPGAALSTDVGALSFTGVDPHKDTLQSLTAMGFNDAEHIARSIADWHRGALRSTRSARGRELLTTLTPALLEALARAGRPDEAFVALDEFLRQLPRGVQIFSLWTHHPRVFEVLIQIITASPWLGRALARRRHIIEAMTESAWPPAPQKPAALRTLLVAAQGDMTPPEAAFEDDVNVVRRWAAEENFTTAAELVIGRIDARDAAARFSDVAEAVIAEMLPLARRETERHYGSIAGDVAVIGFGRLGARAMTAASDIDIVFVYDTPIDAQSTGEHAVEAMTYFSRMVRRFLTGISTPTAEGVLYEVDMALRPSGRAGPAAISLDAFQRYHLNDAWTWERMAMVKARVIAGGDALAGAIDQVKRSVMQKKTPEATLFNDVNDMRERLIREKPPKSNWDVKAIHGGLTDIDFILQALALRWAPHNEGVVEPATEASLFSLAVVGEIGEDDSKALLTAHELFETVIQISRAASGGVFNKETAGAALGARMAAAMSARDIEGAEERLAAQATIVRGIYNRVMRP